MRRLLLAVLLAAPTLALAAPPAGAATTCSGPAPHVGVGRHVATGAIRVDAAASGWSCTGGATPTLSQSSLLLRPPACFTATLTVTVPGGGLATASGQGCG
jgi:hypothetical protein